MLTTIVPINLCLRGRPCIGHRDIVGSCPRISHGTVLRGILIARVSIRGAATSAPSEFRRHIGSWLLSPIAVIVLWLRWCHLLCLNLLLCLLKPSLKAVLHGLPASAGPSGDLYAGDVYLRPLFPHYGFIELFVVTAPPLRVDQRI